MPSNKTLKPEEWATIFRKPMQFDYIEPNTGAMKTKQVPKAEVSDAAIAEFDKTGKKLEGGILYDLMQAEGGKDIKLSKRTILRFIEGSPSNHIKVIKHGTTYFKNRADNLINDLDKLDDEISNASDFTRGKTLATLQQEKEKLYNLQTIDTPQYKAINQAIGLKERLADYKGGLDYGIQTGVVNDSRVPMFDNVLPVLTSARQLGVNSNLLDKITNDGKTLDSLFKDPNTIKKFFDRNIEGQNVTPINKYAEAYGKDYRFMGSKDFFEDNLYLDEGVINKLPEQLRNLYLKTHFGTDPKGQQVFGTIFHIRGGTRAVQGPGNKDAIVIDEMQSDLHQTNQKKVKRIRDNFIERLINKVESEDIAARPTGPITELQAAAKQNKDIFKEKIGNKYKNMSLEDRQKSPLVKVAAKNFYQTAKNIRQNPFNRQDLLEAINGDTIKTLSDEMVEIAKAGRYITQKQALRFNEIADELAYLKSKAPKQAPPRVPNAAEEIAYFPFFEKEQWATLGIRYLLKKAAKEGKQFVAVNPYEKVGFKRSDGKKVGQLEFYGNYAGKGNAEKTILETNDGKQVDMSMKYKKDKDGDFILDQDRQKIEIPGAATIPSAMRKLGKIHGLNVGKIKVSLSDPDKPYKVLGQRKTLLNPDTGDTYGFREHQAAFKTMDEVPINLRRNVEYMPKGSEDLYYEVYSIEVKPELANIPMTTYKKGGLVVDLFKWR